MANNSFPHTLFEQNFKILADLQGPLIIIFLFFSTTIKHKPFQHQQLKAIFFKIFESSPFPRFSWFLCCRNFDIPSLMFISRNVSKPSLRILMLFTEMHAQLFLDRESDTLRLPNVWQRRGQVGIGRRCTGRSALSRRPGRCTPGGDAQCIGRRTFSLISHGIKNNFFALIIKNEVILQQIFGDFFRFQQNPIQK